MYELYNIMLSCKVSPFGTQRTLIQKEYKNYKLQNKCFQVLHQQLPNNPNIKISHVTQNVG